MIIALVYVLVTLGFEEQTGKFWKSATWPLTVGKLLATIAREKGLL